MHSENDLQKNENMDAAKSDLLCEFRNADDTVWADCEIEQLDLSVRSINGLKRAGYRNASEIISLSREQLMSIKNLGVQSVDEITNVLNSCTIIIKQQTPKGELCRLFVQNVAMVLDTNKFELFRLLLPTYEMMDAVGNEIDYGVLYSNPALRNAIKKKIASYLSDYMFGTESSAVVDLFPKDIIDISTLQEIICEMETDKQIVTLENNVKINKKSLNDFLQDMANHRNRDICLKRLKGSTLSEIGNQYGITKERVRQITVKQLQLKGFNIEENKYKSIYLKYSLPKEDFMLIFDEDEMVFNYVMITCHTNGREAIEGLIDDDAYPAHLREKVNNALLAKRERIYIDSAMVNGRQIDNLPIFVGKTLFTTRGERVTVKALTDMIMIVEYKRNYYKRPISILGDKLLLAYPS